MKKFVIQGVIMSVLCGLSAFANDDCTQVCSLDVLRDKQTDEAVRLINSYFEKQLNEDLFFEENPKIQTYSDLFILTRPLENIG